MKANVLSANCPSRTLLNHATSRWGVLVLVALQGRVMRYSELRRTIEGVSERMLAQTLKSLEEDGFVLRKAYNVVPPHVEYSLTPFGVGAAGHVAELVCYLEAEVNQKVSAQRAVEPVTSEG